MVASEAVPLVLQNDEGPIWTNEMANSPFGICQLRLAYEKETDGNIFFSIFQLLTLMQWCAHPWMESTFLQKRSNS